MQQLNVNYVFGKMILCVFPIFFYFPLVSQDDMKFNYKPHKWYNSPEIHRIIFYNEGKSMYNLAGLVKSVKEKKTTLSLGVNYSRKYYYNKDKNVVRMIDYSKDNQVKVDITYYRFSEFYGADLIKKGFVNFGKTKFVSQHDTINKMIFLEKLKDDKLYTLDTIHYVGNFKPTLIKSYSSENELVYTRVIEYNNDNNKIELNLKIPNSKSVSGKKMFYDSKHRFLYMKRIKKANINPLEYELDSIQIDRFVWEADGFTYHNTHFEDTLAYNYKTRILRTNKRGVKKITHLTEDYNPIYQQATLSHGRTEPRVTNFSYNSNGDLMSKVYDSKYQEKIDKSEFFEYQYDNYNNWIERKKYKKDILIETVERTIEYH